MTPKWRLNDGRFLQPGKGRYKLRRNNYALPTPTSLASVSLFVLASEFSTFQVFVFYNVFNPVQQEHFILGLLWFMRINGDVYSCLILHLKDLLDQNKLWLIPFLYALSLVVKYIVCDGECYF